MMDSVYLMLNPWLLFRFKIGISDNVKRRERENGAITLFHFRLPFARRIESGLHWIYRPLNWPAPKSFSGHSEYHLCLNPAFTLALYVLFPDLPKEAYIAAFFAPVPIDAAVILYGIAAVAYAGIAAVIGLAGYLIYLSF